MDTSKERIEQCRKAEEIQKQWKPTNGDYVLLDFRINKTIVIVTEYTPYVKGNDVWLPRQDQLQDMVPIGKMLPVVCISSIALMVVHPCEVRFKDKKFHANPEHIYWTQFKSMEQLWLAFVMHEKYGKRWDGSDWVVK